MLVSQLCDVVPLLQVTILNGMGVTGRIVNKV